MQYQQVYQERTRGELRNVLDYQLKALTKGDYVLYLKICVKGIFVLYIGCFICVIDVLLEFCIIGDSFKDEMCIIKSRQSLRKVSMWLYREMMEKRLFKKRKKVEKERRCYVCVLTFIQVDPSG